MANLLEAVGLERITPKYIYSIYAVTNDVLETITFVLAYPTLFIV